MRIIDIIKISQKNLLRAKLRTFLTIAAVFIGALTLSLTNGVGNGIKAYVNTQLGNLGAEDTLIIQPKQQQFNPTDSEIRKYNPDKQVGSFNFTVFTDKDIENIKNTEGILNITPEHDARLEYITTYNEKYEATANQYVDGLNIDMSAGRVVSSDSLDEISIPRKYIIYGTPEKALNQYVLIGFKDSNGKIIEWPVKIVGVQEQSLLGNSGISISARLAEEIHKVQTANNPILSKSYVAVTAKVDKNYTKEQMTELKDRLGKFNYRANTLEDQIGIVDDVINGILTVLNIFAAITLLAAGFGIINTLLMSVNERTSEIGLMKALGANRKTIFSIFAIEAGSIGLWGAILGVAVSIGVGQIANRIATDTFLKNFIGFDLLAFPVLPSIAVVLGIILLAFIAGALPSLKASKLDPIKALRYE